MSETALRAARVVSVVAATLISLASGTNYVYSAWAPQFAKELKLSATESNLIGAAGNLGMYAMGVPIGLVVDHKGPRIAVILGAVLLFSGYYPIHKAFVGGPGSMSVPVLCFFSLLTGMGGCSSFSAAIKTSALNWPHHRGTATAFPLAAFGLSAFFFSTLSQFAFPDDTGNFLFLLAVGTSTIVFVSFFFLRVVPPSSAYSVVPGHENSNPLHRTKSQDSKYSGSHYPQDIDQEIQELPLENTGETSSLISKSSSSDLEDLQPPEEMDKDHQGRSHHLDIRGLAMLKRIEFYQLFILLGLLTGVGLMTINNIGNDARALWSHWDDSVSSGFLQKRQAMHVSLLSIMSFVGRLLSGVGSDVLVKRFHMSRFWCIVISAFMFCVAQVCAMNVENPNHLFAVSSLTGLAYGFLFGVYPTLVTDAFGINGLSQNWGGMTLAPVFSGNIFNLFYGAVYDHHSTVLPNGERDCPEGLACYRTAYVVTFISSLAGAAVCLWSIRHEHSEKARKLKEGDDHQYRDA